MAVVTLDGQIGAGAPEVGRQVAKILDYDFHDRLLLAGVARRVGATVEAVEARELGVHGRSDRFWSFLERVLAGLAMGGAASEPFFCPPVPDLLPLTWDESPTGPKTSPHQLRPREVAEALSDHIRAVAAAGNAVIVHRAGCVELRGLAGTLRVGLFAPWELRVRRLMRREGMLRIAEAERSLAERERAQAAYFREFHGADPHDPSLYDISVDTSMLNLDMVALEIARAVRGLPEALRQPERAAAMT
ncbi:MAG: cytidylate kinase-like family protein [Gemmatimonadetes bacterium]|nr:cytidylate kinase-like family protein [Gemmatimonadota bacterium]